MTWKFHEFFAWKLKMKGLVLENAKQVNTVIESLFVIVNKISAFIIG